MAQDIPDALVEHGLDGSVWGTLVERAKLHGYILTFDEIDAALPGGFTFAQRRAVLAALSGMGVAIVEDEPAEEAAPINVEPGGTLAIDARALAEMREQFLARFPDFEERGFDADEGSYWDVERHYKQRLIEGAATVLQQGRNFTPYRIGAHFLDILASKESNLLDWRESRRLEEVRAEAPRLIEQALGELVLSKAQPAEIVGQFVAKISEAYLKGQEGNMPYAHLRTLPTTALALARPSEAIAVRYTTMHRAGVRLTGGSLFKNAPMTAQEYQVVLQIARHVERVMRDAWGWRPRDLWDVQGFLWVVTTLVGDPTAPVDPPIELPQDDRYRTQTDDPARLDALERGPFAAVLAARIVEVRKSARGEDPEDDRAFMVHLHGPWGSGKSSMLNLIERELEHPSDGGAPSLVVWFNAWKHQRMRPPWWALLSAVYRAAVRKSYEIGTRPQRNEERRALQALWLRWRLRADWGPLLIVTAVLAAILSFAVASGTLQLTLTAGAGALGVAAAIYTYVRPALFGSAKAAQTYADLTTDPYSPVVKLFGDLVARIKPPLVVFIDDLDRCDSDYVVELLEGIQTLFRGAPVTYVVAAERKWICSSFEKKYGDFAGSIGEPCRPLGYLFLDKLFQISAGMPRLTPEIQSLYLEALLADGAPEPTAPDAALVAEAKERVRGISDEDQIQEAIAETEGKSVAEQRAVRAAAALQITSAEATRTTEHRLKKLAHLLEPNPRSMKRLVNAVGMAQARGILEGRVASPETRARWAMLNLRWPLLAEFIADNPAGIGRWQKPAKATAKPAKADPDWPEAVRLLYGNTAVMEVVGGAGDEGALTSESLAPMLA